MKKSYQKFITPLYVINIIFQAFVTLISSVAISFLFAWLLVKYLSVGTWIYVVLIIIGVFSGLYSMIVFLLRASRAVEAIDKQNSTKSREGGKSNN